MFRRGVVRPAADGLVAGKMDCERSLRMCGDTPSGPVRRQCGETESALALASSLSSMKRVPVSFPHRIRYWRHGDYKPEGSNGGNALELHKRVTEPPSVGLAKYGGISPRSLLKWRFGPFQQAI